MTDSVEGATSAEASVEAAASLPATTGAGEAVEAVEALGVLGSLGAFTTFTGVGAGEAEAVVGAGEAEAVVGAGEAEAVVGAVEAVAEAEVLVVLAISLVGYTLYREVFLSFFTNNVFIRAFHKLHASCLMLQASNPKKT